MGSTRGVTTWALVVTMAVGLLAPAAQAQQPSQGDVTTDVTMEYGRRTRGTDIYDIAAPVATVLKIGGNVITCAVGAGFGTGLFFLSMGSAYKGTTRIIEEGCAQKWIIRGHDLRPKGAPGFYERRDLVDQR